jgi:hypothetical protein
MQIGQVTVWTGRARQVVVSAWVQGLFPGSTGSKKSIVLSSTEAEYTTSNLASYEAIWVQKLLMGLFDQVLDTTMIHCDNQSCIRLSEDLVFHDRSKHIEIRYHFL